MPIDIEALLQPISESHPCGADLRNHPVFIQIREARREEENLAQGVWEHDVKEADYALALKLAKEALTKRGKDLQVAAWTTEALLRLEGFDGLRQGLELMRRLLDTHWDSVHPQIDEDGDLEMRATPLRWAGSQLDSAIRSVPLTKGGHNWYQYKQSRAMPSEDAASSDPAKQAARADALGDGETPPEEFARGFESTPVAFFKQTYDTLTGLLEAVQALSEYCDEKFGEAAPDFGPLRTTLEDVQQTARVLLKQKGGSEGSEPAEGGDAEAEPGETWQEEETAAAGGEAQADGTVPAAAAPRRRASGGGIEPSSPDDAIDRLLAASRYLRRENPDNSAGYLIPRTLRWGELRAAGAYADAAVLAAPPSDLRISLKRLAAEGAWDRVGDLAENAAGQPCGRAWLDLQRYACYACEFAGHDAVRDAILAGLKSLLADLPQVLQWTLADDTPAANLETMAWLKERGVLPGDQAEAKAAAAEPVAPQAQPVWYPPPRPVRAASAREEGAEPGPPDSYELAMQTAQSGNVEEALDILSRELAQEPCGRDRFLRKIQLAQLCLATGNETVAEPILQELSEEIDRRKLAEWELADVVAQPLTLLYRCLDRAPEAAAEKRGLYARICRLYPAGAVRLGR
jgi:type VI secretion system protein ImpA